MPITREVLTKVYCDNCGEFIAGWKSTGKYSNGVSKEWAKRFVRLDGCTTGKEITCKSCRIEKKIASCSLLKKHGIQDTTDGVICLGFCNEGGELMEKCKKCIAHSEFDWEEERRRLE